MKNSRTKSPGIFYGDGEIRISETSHYKISPLPLVEGLFYGGDGEIRTLEELLTLTRFPIVRARPTTRHLRVCSKNKLSTCQLAHYNSYVP